MTRDHQASETTTDGLRGAAFRAMLWSFAEKWGTRIGSFLTILVLTRLVSPEDFGVIAMAMAISALATLLAESGFGRAVVQRADLTQAHKNAAFLLSTSLGLLFAGVVYLGAGLAADMMDAPVLEPVLQWMCLSIIFGSLTITPAALLERDLKFGALARRRLVATALGCIVAVSCAIAGLGVWALVAQFLTASSVTMTMSWIAARWVPSFSFSWTAVTDLWSVGIRIVLMELVGFLNSHADKLVVGAFAGTAALGYYFLAIQLIWTLVDLLAAVFTSVSLAVFSRLQADRERLKNWYLGFISVSSFSAFPVFAFLTFIGPVLLPVMLGDGWDESSRYFQILTALGAITAVMFSDRSLLVSINRAGAALAMTTVQSIFFLAVLILAAPHGVMAIVVAMAVRPYLFLPFRTFFIRRAAGVSGLAYFGAFAPPMLVSLAALGVMTLIAEFTELLDINPLLAISISALMWAVLISGISRLLFPRQLARLIRSVPVDRFSVTALRLLRLR